MVDLTAVDKTSLALAACPVLDLCLRYGSIFINVCQAYAQANARISDLATRIKAIWLKSERQMAFLRSIWDSVDTPLRIFQEEVLQKLHLRLHAAILQLYTLTGPARGAVLIFVSGEVELGQLKKAQYSVFESYLKKIIDDLEAWHRIFDPSWFLITRIPRPSIDSTFMDTYAHPHNELSMLQQIRQAIHNNKGVESSKRSMMRNTGFITANRQAIHGSTCVLTQENENLTDVLLDRTAYPQGTDLANVCSHVCELALLLSHCDSSTLGLLQCVGVLKMNGSSSQPEQFAFLFGVPVSLKSPVSLRALLSQPPVSLDQRFQLAKSLARSIISVHTAGFVHKNIRPEVIIVFQPDEYKKTLASFLVGFERFRPLKAETTPLGDMLWERNLYRHPRRQGMYPDDEYMMQHDIYSLGVCLLEIGLWLPFVCTEDSATSLGASVEDPPIAQPNPILNIAEQLKKHNQQQAAIEIKRRLLNLAENDLPSKMGNNYTDVVRACLTCLDSGTTNLFEDVVSPGRSVIKNVGASSTAVCEGEDVKSIQSHNDITIGVQYMEKIIVKLEAILI